LKEVIWKTEKKTLNRILRKQIVRIWTGYRWIRIMSNVKFWWL
jgi:hypothetical protein